MGSENLLDAPSMIGQTSSHRWCLTELLVWPTQIRGASNQVYALLKGLQALTGMMTFACLGSQAFSHRPIQSLKRGGIGLRFLLRLFSMPMVGTIFKPSFPFL